MHKLKKALFYGKEKLLVNDFNLKTAIEKRQIIPFTDGPKLVLKELQAAQDDLQDAKDNLNIKKFKVATVTSYFAMFHAARSLLYNKKYREKSHIQLIYAIKELYIKTGLLSNDYYENHLRGMQLREVADYKLTFSEEGAEKNIEAAEKNINMAKKLLT